MSEKTPGQYGKQNPCFMYQGTAGYSISAVLLAAVSGKPDAQGFAAEPPPAGLDPCGTKPIKLE